MLYDKKKVQWVPRENKIKKVTKTNINTIMKTKTGHELVVAHQFKNAESQEEFETLSAEAGIYFPSNDSQSNNH